MTIPIMPDNCTFFYELDENRFPKPIRNSTILILVGDIEIEGTGNEEYEVKAKMMRNRIRLFLN